MSLSYNQTISFKTTKKLIDKSPCSPTAVVSNIYVKSAIKVTPDDTELSGKDGHNGIGNDGWKSMTDNQWEGLE